MAHVTYEGPSDRYELTAADWKALGVEDGQKTVFERGESYDVEQNVLDALLGDKVAGFKELSDAQVARLLGQDTSDENAVEDTGAKATGLDAAGTGTTTTTTGRGSRSGRGSTSTSST